MDGSHGSVTAGRSARRRGSPALFVAVLVSAAAHLPSALLHGRAHAAATPVPTATEVVTLFEAAPPPPVDAPRVELRDVPANGPAARAAANLRVAGVPRGPSDAADLDLDALFPIASTGGGGGGAGGAAARAGGAAGRAGSEPVDVDRPARVVASAVAVTPSRGTPARALASEWSCPFPEEADAEDAHVAVVTVEVDVAVDGRVMGVRVLVDPGAGFGRAARSCAARQRFVAATGPTGAAVAGTTLPIRVRFAR